MYNHLSLFFSPSPLGLPFLFNPPLSRYISLSLSFFLSLSLSLSLPPSLSPPPPHPPPPPPLPFTHQYKEKPVDLFVAESSNHSNDSDDHNAAPSRYEQVRSRQKHLLVNHLNYSLLLYLKPRPHSDEHSSQSL